MEKGCGSSTPVGNADNPLRMLSTGKPLASRDSGSGKSLEDSSFSAVPISGKSLR
jgi:hypothetical protein